MPFLNFLVDWQVFLKKKFLVYCSSGIQSINSILQKIKSKILLFIRLYAAEILARILQMLNEKVTRAFSHSPAKFYFIVMCASRPLHHSATLLHPHSRRDYACATNGWWQTKPCRTSWRDLGNDVDGLQIDNFRRKITKLLVHCI